MDLSEEQQPDKAVERERQDPDGPLPARLVLTPVPGVLETSSQTVHRDSPAQTSIVPHTDIRAARDVRSAGIRGDIRPAYNLS